MMLKWSHAVGRHQVLKGAPMVKKVMVMNYLPTQPLQ